MKIFNILKRITLQDIFLFMFLMAFVIADSIIFAWILWASNVVACSFLGDAS